MNTKQVQKVIGWSLLTVGLYLYIAELWVLPTVFGFLLATDLTVFNVEYRSEKDE